MSPRTVTRKLIESHLLSGRAEPGEDIAISVDQAFMPDPSGVLVFLELEALGVDRVRTPFAAVYVDHNLLQSDGRNAADHLFLRSACRRYGLWFSPPGNGISHAVHAQRHGAPGRTVVACDSHTPAAGSLGMLGIGVGGLDVAMVLAGEPLRMRMPRVWGVELTGALPPWVSAKDVILEMLRRHGEAAGRDRIIEYHGPGVDSLSTMDRHVIASMGTELGAVSSVFPADAEVRRYLELENRRDDYAEVYADEGARYDVRDTLDLSRLEPLIAKPPSPGNVVPVGEVAGLPIHQAYIGSSANVGLRDLAVPAMLVKGLRVADGVSFDVNPASRQTLQNLVQLGLLNPLLHAGARLHQAGCNGCIGLGQSPASGRPSLRTTPRNFPGRSGTKEDAVYLVSPETATASALTGVVTDPRDLPDLFGVDYPAYADPAPGAYVVDDAMLPPPPADAAREVVLVRGPNTPPLPGFDPLPDRLDLPVLLAVGDGLSTDLIIEAGAQAMPARGNVAATAEFLFRDVDPGYVARAKAVRDPGHAIVAGANYGLGSSREHAALAPRAIGLRAVIAVSFARIHWLNLVNFGIVPLEFTDPRDRSRIGRDDVLVLRGIRDMLASGDRLTAMLRGSERPLALRHRMTPQQVDVVLAGGLLSHTRSRGERSR